VAELLVLVWSRLQLQLNLKCHMQNSLLAVCLSSESNHTDSANVMSGHVAVAAGDL